MHLTREILGCHICIKDWRIQISDKSARSAENRVIQRVVDFPAQLEHLALSNFDILHERHVQIEQPVQIQLIPAARAVMFQQGLANW